MSWRVLILILLLSLGAAAAGGVRLGDWLVAHAPVAAPPPNPTQEGKEPVLDADGRPYTAQPPQPRVDGTLGVPEPTQHAEWTVESVSVFETNTDPSVLLGRAPLSAAEVGELTHANRALQGQTDVATLDVTPPLSPYGQGTAPYPPGTYAPGTYPLDAGQMPPASTSAPPPTGDWLVQLRRELAECADLGFFQRPTCAWNARNRHCSAGNAWGQVRECPRRDH